MQSLDDGEQQAISLALIVGANTLLIDERRGTTVAKSLGLTTWARSVCLPSAAVDSGLTAVKRSIGS